MKQLIIGAKMRLGWINPFKIKTEYCLLSKQSEIQVTLQEKELLTQDTQIMRFQLPDQNKCLGTLVGQYISLNDPSYDKNLTKGYAPISRIDDSGYFDLLVRQIPNGENLTFSQNLFQAKIGHTFNVKGPFSSYFYEGKGQFQLKRNGQLETVNKRYLGLICEETAITAFFQLIEGIATNGDHTHISLIYVCDKVSDFHLAEELLWFVDEKKIHLQLLLRKEQNEYWPSLKGDVTPIKIQDYLPPPSEDTLIMICGTQEFKGQLRQVMSKLDYPEEQVYFV